MQSMKSRRITFTAAARAFRAVPRRATALAALVVLGLGVPGTASAAGRTKGKSKPAPSSVRIKSGALTIVFLPDVYSALSASGTGAMAQTRTVSTVAPATTPVSGSFVFPLTRGTLNVERWTGTIASSGGIELQEVTTLSIFATSASRFDLESFSLALSATATASALDTTFVGAPPTPGVPIAVLLTRKASHSLHGRTLRLSGIGLTLTSDGVRLLSGQANGFEVGETIGTASVTATIA